MKYHNKKTTVNGITFHSKKEAARYQELKLQEKAKEISNLKLQVPFIIEVGGRHICKYLADFTYFDKEGEFFVEDVKGCRTSVYRLKKKLVEALYGIEILET